GDVRGPDRRDRVREAPVLGTPTPLHVGPVALDTEARDRPHREARPDPGDAAEPDQPPVRLPLPHAVRLRAARTCARRPAPGAARARAHALRRLPAARAGARAAVGR